MKKLSLLKIGNLYEGWWLDNSREKMNIFWLESGEQVSLSCFVLLEKKRSKKVTVFPNTKKNGSLCKILTSEGIVGWKFFVEGCYWFKELK